MDARHLPPELLNQRRRQAVELRLAGHTVAEVAAAVELSRPTIIAAHKAYLAGGWEAVDVRRRGRTAGAGRKLDPTLEHRLLAAMADTLPDGLGLPHPLWCDEAVAEWLRRETGQAPPRRSLARYRTGWGLRSAPTPTDGQNDPGLAAWIRTTLKPLGRLAGTSHEFLWTQVLPGPGGPGPAAFLLARGARGRLWWLGLAAQPRAGDFITLWSRLLGLARARPVLVAHGFQLERVPDLREWLAGQDPPVLWAQCPGAGGSAPHSLHPPLSVTGRSMTPAPATVTPPPALPPGTGLSSRDPDTLTHLQRLEAESIHIMREVVAEAEKPVMLYSIGKDSAVMLHLAMKAFHPAVPPFPLLHVDTTWKFRAMYEFRDAVAGKTGMELIVHVNQEGLERGINPFTHGSAIHTDVMKTEGLKQALEKYGFDVAFGGARRDEEKSRAKERIFSFRTAQHRWDPKNQRPELWSLYNARKHRGESIRVFPLSNWTELDIWQYIYLEDIPIVPLYYAAPRPVVERDGTLIMVDDGRMPLKPGEVPMIRKVRFRTLGCYPLTGAIESEADSLPAIIQEMLLARTSERQGRIIDHDSAASMERKKQEGYF